MKINNTFTNTMKSNDALIGMAFFWLAIAVLASAIVWGEISSAVKIGMYAFGFATGVAAGALIVKRRNQANN